MGFEYASLYGRNVLFAVLSFVIEYIKKNQSKP